MQSRYGDSEIVKGGSIGGLGTQVMRPMADKLPYLEVEVIDLNGNVLSQRVGRGDQDWDFDLRDQGRVVVAVMNGKRAAGGAAEELAFERMDARRKRGEGMGLAPAGSQLERLRAEHGYKIVRDPTGRQKAVIELLPGDSEIRRRRAEHRAEIEESRRNKPADRVTMAEAMARMNAQPQPQSADVMAALAEFRAENAKLAAQVRELKGEAPPAPPAFEHAEGFAEDPDDVPPPESTPKKKGR